MKAQLLPFLATVCLTAVANSQSPDQPRRDSERQAPENPAARRPNPETPRVNPRPASPEQPRRDVRRPEPEQMHRDAGHKPQPGGLAPWNRRSDAREDGARAPQIHRPSVGERPDLSHRSPGFSSMPQGPRVQPDALTELREQVRSLTRQVHELRAMVEAQRNGMQRFSERRNPAPKPPFSRGSSGHDSRDSHAPMPPKRDSREGDHRMHRDGGSRDHGNPNPNGNHPRPPQGDHRSQETPPAR